MTRIAAPSADFLKGVRAAEAALRDVMAPTPLQRNAYLSERFGAEILLKREDLSPVRSYKLRGAFSFFRKALDGPNPPRRFVCASAGNHAQGFAYACRHFNVDGVVFMPVTTPKQKIDKTRAFGGDHVRIELFGDIFDQCNRAALDYAAAEQAAMVPPFDHQDIIEGQATVAEEILDETPRASASKHIDLLALPVGGGGLAAGVTQVFAARSPDTEIVMIEPAGAPSLNKSLGAGELVTLNQIDNFVDGAAVARIGEKPWEILNNYGTEDTIQVSEDEICVTILEMLNAEGIVLEPAGAMQITALSHLPKEMIAGKTVVCVISGGNFDFERLPEVKERALKAQGLKKYFVLRLPQRPGALRDFLALLGPDDDISRFEYLKKSARNFGSILLGVETTKRENFDRLTDAMMEAGFQFRDITGDELVGDFIV